MGKTLKERRETDRERQRRWRAKHRSQGKRPISIMLSNDVKDLINQEKRRTGETIAQLVERAIRHISNPDAARLDDLVHATAAAEKPPRRERADSLLKRIIEAKEI